MRAKLNLIQETEQESDETHRMLYCFSLNLCCKNFAGVSAGNFIAVISTRVEAMHELSCVNFCFIPNFCVKSHSTTVAGLTERFLQ